MRLVILVPSPPDCMAFGARQLSSVLERSGHDVSLVFLRGDVGDHLHDGSYVYQYPASILRDVVEICRGADAIGVSFMSMYWDRAVQVTRAVQEAVGAPVIWGGAHPTVRPEESIRIADYVCVGEGEIATAHWLEALAGRGDPSAVQGIWARVGGEVIDNGTAPEVRDINELPWPDFDTHGHYVSLNGRVVPMTTERMRHVLPRVPFFGGRQAIGMRVMATRGCPHRCTYCASSAHTTMRRRTVESTVEHMAWLAARYPFIDVFYEFDDTFFASSMSWLSEFADRYNSEVGLPWYCQTSPTTLNREKLELLVDHGLVYLEIGVQSGSAEIRELFLRSETEEQVLEATDLLHEYWAQGRLLPPRYHVIVDVPWESSESFQQTVNLFLRVKRPFEIGIASLALFPGTYLNEVARAEGLLTDELTEVYRHPFYIPQPTLLNWIVWASAVEWIDRDLLHRLMSPRALRLLGGGDGMRPTAFSRALFWSTQTLDKVPRATRAFRNHELERILRGLGT